ncbi:OsmC family protein [Streptomyces sp. NPDC006207]
MDATETTALRRVALAVARTTDQDYRIEIRTGHHTLTADEPEALGGTDTGPTPFGLLLSALGSCTAITLRMYAQRKGWPLSGLGVRLAYEKAPATAKGPAADRIIRRIALAGELDDPQRARLLDVAERTPVTLAVRAGVPIETSEDRH